MTLAADAPALLYEGADWDFDTIRAHPRRHRGDRRRRARPRRLSEPDRDHHGRADARRLFVDRHAAVLQALVVRQAVRPARGRSTARGCAAWPTRSSSTPIPASATSWRRTPRRCRRWSSPMPPSATTISSRTTTCSAVDGCRRHPRLSRIRQGLHHRMRGALRPGGRRARARRRACADAATASTATRARRLRTCARRSGASASACAQAERIYNDLWRTVPGTERQRAKPALTTNAAAPCSSCRRRTSSISSRGSAPRLQPWQREILRIVRLMAQYFYPQRQTKVMNEGCATYCHYRIMQRLHERGEVGDGVVPGIPEVPHQRRLPAGASTTRASAA